MNPIIIIANTQRTIGLILALFVMIGMVVYLLFNFRIGKKEVGSEIDLAANRVPYADDDELETRILDKALGWSFVLIAATALVLPLYWLCLLYRSQRPRDKRQSRRAVSG